MIMKTTRYLFLVLLTTLIGMGAKAQQRNVLQVPDIETQIGNAQLPVNIENTDEIVGVQFDLTLPHGVMAETTGILTERCDDHVITVTQVSNGAYRVLLHSAQNHPLHGQSGIVMYLPITIPETFEEGSDHPLAISNVVLGVATGENVLTEAMAGTIRILKKPDLTVKNISADKTTLTPGEDIVVSWQVENIGELATGNGWNEQVSLVSEGGSMSILIATIDHEEPLESSGIVSRQIDVTLPTLLGFDGPTKLQVEIITTEATGEPLYAQANNTVMSETLYQLNKVLMLTLYPSRVKENSNTEVTATISRSGWWNKAETFNITATEDARITVPQTVTIPLGQATKNIHLTVTDNDNPDENAVVTVTVVGNGYEAAQQQLEIEDDDKNIVVQTNKETYKAGETVLITGEASYNAKVIVYVIHNGKEEKINVLTDDNGKFTAAYNISDLQSGHFSIKAGYPKGNVSEELASFDCYGIQLSQYKSETDIELGTPIAGTIIITNTVPLKQTGLKIEKQTETEDCTFEFTVPEEIEGDGSVEIAYTITPNAISEGTEWLQLPIEITTAEGGKAKYTFYYYVQSAIAVLSAEPANIGTTMTMGTTRQYPLVITNNGRGDTGAISLGLPNFINTATPRKMPSLAGGESATIILELTPTEYMQLNVPVEGHISINCENGDGLSVGFSIEPVSESTGFLTVEVTDDLTYYAETESVPHVKGAKIEIKHPVTEAVIASGISDENGLFTVELPEGLYILDVTEGKHEEYKNLILIDPDRHQTVEAFLSYQYVTYDWNVEETEVEDLYNISLNAEYDVRVPKPVLLVKLAVSHQPIDGTVIPVEVTNKGLININDVNVFLAVSPSDYEIEFLTEPYLDYLAPLQTEVFYAKVTYIGPAEARQMTGEHRVYGIKAATARAIGTYLCSKEKDVIGDDFKAWGISGSGLPDITNIIKDLAGQLDDLILKHKHKIKKPTNYISDVHNWSQIIPQLNLADICYRLYDPNNPHDPNNPNNPNAANDPIDLPNMDNMKEPTEQDCDSNAEPKLSYILVPVSGKKYQVNGVAADGVSQVKIILDSTSVVPPKDCENINILSWKLSRNLGKIEGSSVHEAIYTAPDHFPSISGSVATVEAIVQYQQRISEYENVNRNASVTIQIVRPPVVFVHGLGDSQKCWKELDEMLTNPSLNGSSLNTALYLDGINYRADYKITNTHAFSVNVPVIGNSIHKAQRRALSKGFVATKCDLVGHSMGGILSRLYVQDCGGENLVNRIITVNTPHAGSELGDAVMAHNVIMGNLARIFYSALNLQIKIDINALRDLGVESEAIDHLNYATFGLIPDIPVYSIATQKNYTISDISQIGLQQLLSLGNSYLMLKGPIGIASNVALKYLSHFVCDDWSQVDPGDMIVSTESQIGGCMKSRTFGGGLFGDGPWHCNSPANNNVQREVKEMLAEFNNSTKFSKEWFHPTKRSFYHDIWQLELMGNMALDFVSPLNKLEYRRKFKKVADNLGIDPYQNGNFKSGKLTQKAIERCAMAKKAFVTITRSTRGYMMDSQESPARFLNLELLQVDGFSNPLVVAVFGEDEVVFEESYNVQCEIPTSFSGDVKLFVFQYNNEDNLVYFEDYLYTIDEPLATPVSLTLEETTLNVDDSEELRLYCTWNDGTETLVVPDSVSFEHEKVATLVGKYIVGLKSGLTNVTASYRGLTCVGLIRVFTTNNDEVEEIEPSNSVCAKVSLSFNQEMVMTRQAFRGILTVNNGSGTKELKDLKLNLEVKDEWGNVATDHEFQISPESLKGFNGELNFTSGWSLYPESMGFATILYIPTKYAADTAPKKWWFGGTISYTDPDTELTVTRELYAVPLTVNPTPELVLDYFLQRDVFGDDALTEDVVEPSVPAEFSLLINNMGNGDAKDVSMTTYKPEIIDNEKGLLINFNLLNSQLNGVEEVLALGTLVTNNFGTIETGKTAYAQWWFESSLTGHFREYDVSANHLTSWGNSDLSLLGEVRAHELIHTLKMTDGTPAWLVNDMPDSKNLPDRLFKTDGNTEDVAQATATIVEDGDNQYILTTTPGKEGWNYGNIIDPTAGLRTLVTVTRNSDGASIDLANFWQTDRTLRDYTDPIYEFRLHFADEMAADGEIYTLVFESKPSNNVTVDYDLAEGWNWISTSLTEEGIVDAMSFLDPIKENVSRLVSFTNELINDPIFGFVGGLTKLSLVEGYKLLMKKSSTFSYTGRAAESMSNAVTLQQGWNWIGFLPEKSLAVNIALAGLTPMENDLLKSIDGFATYADNSWKGTLTEMKPGEGYMYYSGQTTTFTYPKVLPNPTAEIPKQPGLADGNRPWQYNVHLFADNMAVIGKLYIGNNAIGDGFIVGAFCGNECRGVGKIIDGIIFMTIHGKETDTEPVVLRAYEKITGYGKRIRCSI